MEVRILGPIEVWHEGRQVRLGRRQQRLVLGFLALEADQVVSGDRLIAQLWGADPPRRARAVVQSRISELRAALGSVGVGPITSVAAGYILRIDQEQVDAHRAAGLMRTARRSGQHGVARTLLREALGLFRGPVLEGFPSASAGGFESARLTASEDLFELEVRHGDPGSVVDELALFAEAHPGRERLTASLMTALDRSGRRAEALQVYQRCRRHMVTALGIEPGRDLQDLHRTMLRGSFSPTHDASLPTDTRVSACGAGVSAGAVRGAGVSAGAACGARLSADTLPADVADFTGRVREASTLRRLLATSRAVTVTGPAGVGKTALSVHIAHSLRSSFPDGQLFVDLRSDQPSVLLGRLLRALGVDTVPDEPADRVDLYRRLLASRRVLLILDDAASVEQVRPLIPGGRQCAVLVTARPRLAAALGAESVELGLLSPTSALQLLARLIGTERLGREPQAAADLANLCGHLPLALRAAGAQLAAKPHWTLEHLVGRFRRARRRLDEHSYGTLDIRASIDRSYAPLPNDAQHLLRRLGDAALPEVDAATCAALIHRPIAEAETLLELLHDAHLLTATGGGRIRYHLNHLVRLYARERTDLEGRPVTARTA